MIPLLESKFGLVERKKEVISFESNVDLKGIHLLPLLFNAIINERVLKIDYKDFKSSEPYEIIFHPYYLKQFNNRWFCFGFNEANFNSFWNLALDRIEDLSETDKIYRKSQIDWDDYFYDIIGVTRPEGVEPQEIVLKFAPSVAPYVITKPMHPSQKHRNDPTGLEVRIRVVPNYELEKKILSFGEAVQVISPKEVREGVFKRLKKASQQY